MLPEVCLLPLPWVHQGDALMALDMLGWGFASLQFADELAGLRHARLFAIYVKTEQICLQPALQIG